MFIEISPSEQLNTTHCIANALAKSIITFIMLFHLTKFPRVLLQLQSSTFCSFSLSRSGRSGRSTAEDHLQGPHQSEVALVCEWGDDQTKRIPEILITVRTTCCNLMKSRRLQFTTKKRLQKKERDFVTPFGS